MNHELTETRGRVILCRKQGKAEKFRRITHPFVSGHQLALAVSPGGSQVQGVQCADKQRRSVAITSGHDAIKFSFHLGIRFNNADLAGGDVLMHLGQNGFGGASPDETFTFFTKGYAP